MNKQVKKWLEEVKEKGYWKEGDVTYTIERSEYPHNEQCEGSMCWCAARAKKEDPKKWAKHRVVRRLGRQGKIRGRGN